jgi:hypothetical protein
VPLIPAAEMLQIFAPVTAFTNRIFRDAHEAGVLRDFGTHDMGAFIGGGLQACAFSSEFRRDNVNLSFDSMEYNLSQRPIAFPPVSKRSSAASWSSL